MSKPLTKTYPTRGGEEDSYHIIPTQFRSCELMTVDCETIPWLRIEKLAI